MILAKAAEGPGWQWALAMFVIVTSICGMVLAWKGRRWPKHPDPTQILKEEEKREKRNRKRQA